MPNVVRESKPIPTGGWRRLLYRASGGRYIPQLSAAEQHDRAVHGLIRRPLHGLHRVAVVSVKGGSGKTTTTLLLGHVLAALRGDRVAAIDCNPDAGNLADRVGQSTAKSVRDLVLAAPTITTATSIREFTSQASSRLEVVASDQDSEVSEQFSEQDYRTTVDVLSRFYSIILTDSGTGMLHAAMPGVLHLADTLVFAVGGMRADGVKAAVKTVDWLEAHGYGHLVRTGIAVISGTPTPGQDVVDQDSVIDYFRSRCSMVIEIPYDGHLAVGDRIDIDRLAPETRAAAELLAAAVAERFR